jgi:hypothetical protein
MDEVPPAPELSAFVRYGFATVFVAACLYDLKTGVRVAGVFLLGQSFYQAMLGRVPLTGWSWQTTGYLKGPAASALVAAMIFLSLFFIFTPDVVLRLLATVTAP